MTLSVFDSEGVAVADERGEPAAGTFRGTVIADEDYYFRITSVVDAEATAPDVVDPSGPDANYVIDVAIVDGVPPVVTSTGRLPIGEADSPGQVGSLLSTFTLSVSEVLDASSVNVPVETFFTNGDSTYVVLSSRTYAAASDWATTRGGHLVHIDSAEENAFLQTAVGAFRSMYIGLSDEATEGTWLLSNGDEPIYTNWQNGYPRTSTTNNAAYFNSNSGTWYDYRATNSLESIIEFDSSLDTDLDGTPDVIDAFPGDERNGYEIVSSGDDGIFDTEDDQSFDVRPSSTYSGGLDIPMRVYDGPLLPGSYRLTVTSDLRDLVGNRLAGGGEDGDYVGYFDVSIAGSDDLVLEPANNGSIAGAAELTLISSAQTPELLTLEMVGRGSVDPVRYRGSGDFDYWSFTALAGDRVSLSSDAAAADPTGVGGTPDTQLSLYNAAGSRLGNDDRRRSGQRCVVG